MCRKPLLAATALIWALAGHALAAAPAPAPNAQTAAPAAATPNAPPTKPARKASAEERADAERLEPLPRAAFWAHEVTIDPTDAIAGVRLSSALRALKQYAEALDAARQVLVVHPDNLDALLESARAQIGQDQAFYAIDPLKHAEKVAPRDWRAPSLMGVALQQVRRYEDADAAWRQALALSPDNPAVLSNMAMALADRGQAADAEPLLRKAAAQPGASLQVRQNLTLVLGLQGKLGEAEKLLREDLPPDQADANLAYLQALTARPAPAPAAAAPPSARTWQTVKGATS
jgi:Flp pilus assembly protein TadD